MPCRAVGLKKIQGKIKSHVKSQIKGEVANRLVWIKVKSSPAQGPEVAIPP